MRTGVPLSLNAERDEHDEENLKSERLSRKKQRKHRPPERGRVGRSAPSYYASLITTGEAKDNKWTTASIQ